jgi:pimeloyl-ACP methyl ester carboxylesterase
MSRPTIPEETTSMTQAPATHMLDVPGAKLYYEVTGSGPVLALIGLPMEHTGWGELVPALADRHTVVTYDPRGFVNSTVEDPDEDLAPSLVADDVHRLLAAVTDEPAYVLGSSGGAVTGLELTLRHPDQVRLLVAHEPPLVTFLSDVEQRRAQIKDLHETYLREGQGAAWAKFFALMIPDGAPPLDPKEVFGDAPPSPEMIASGDRMLARSLLPTTGYAPDPAALRALAGKIVVGVGATSAGSYPNRTALALAERAGLPVADFPGGHDGFSTDSAAFAERLVQVLARA